MNHRFTASLRAPKTVIVVLRERFELHLYRRVKDGSYARTKFPIAVGKVGDATPGGVYYVDAKSRKPSWTIPENDDYPKETWGSVVPFSEPANPFAGGFISISGGEGIGLHGVRFEAKLGTRASHGCIRLDTKDFLHIYPQVRLGSPVTIV